MKIDTVRLLLRNYQPPDKPQLSKVCSDTEVMKYVFNGTIKIQEFDEFIEKYFASSNADIGLCTLCIKDTNEIIGFAGLLPFEVLGDNDIEFGFVISEPYWGKGFATEIGKVLIKYGKETLGYSRIFATVHPENRASLHVLEKKLSLVKNNESKVDIIEGRGSRVIFKA